MPQHMLLMKFVPYQLLDGRPSVVVDGSPAPGTVLTVTHWPGYPPPAGIEDDLSARWRSACWNGPTWCPARRRRCRTTTLRPTPPCHPVWRRPRPTLSHRADQDGLVSIYALVAPDDAVQRRTFLEDVAFAGDFALCRDRDAARVSMVLSALANGDDLPADCTERTGVLYEDVLGLCPSCATTSRGTATSGATRTPRSRPATPPSRTAGP